MNYDNPTSVLKDYLWSVFRPGDANMKPDIGDVVLLTSKEDGFAVGMIGTIMDDITDIVSNPNDHEHNHAAVVGPTYEMQWKNAPVEIDSKYSCVQSGYISIEDRAEILSQLLMQENICQ
jgi:hypothetical protein